MIERQKKLSSLLLLSRVSWWEWSFCGLVPTAWLIVVYWMNPSGHGEILYAHVVHGTIGERNRQALWIERQKCTVRRKRFRRVFARRGWWMHCFFLICPRKQFMNAATRRRAGTLVARAIQMKRHRHKKTTAMALLVGRRQWWFVPFVYTRWYPVILSSKRRIVITCFMPTVYVNGWPQWQEGIIPNVPIAERQSLPR